MILIVGLGVVLSSLLTIERERLAFRRAAERNVSMLEESIEAMLVREMELGPAGRVSEVLLRAQAKPEVLSVRIFDEKGVVLKSSLPEEEGMAAPPAILDRALKKQRLSVTKTGQERVFSYVKPVANRKRCWDCHGTKAVLGFINTELLAGESERENAIGTSTTIVANAIVMLCIGLGTWIVVRTMIDKRVAPLVQTMKRVEAGDLSARAEVTGQDEIAEFTTAFNVMVSELETAQADLRRYHAEQMEKAERLASLGQLAAGLAHEIKNPLAGISGAIHIIADEIREDDPKREIFDEMLVQVERLGNTVRDLLDFARPPRPELKLSGINDIVSSTLSLLMPQMKGQNIGVVSRFSAHIPSAMVDEKQIQQVFLNLMLNAIQAMPDGGTLEIATHLEARPPHRKPFVRVDLTDTGHGVDKEILGQIFDPFFTTKHKGTGLGLSIAQRIVKEHGGIIDVKSTPGQGSSFSVFIPVGDENRGGRNGVSQGSSC
ncbi:MAG: HAMP domain-containing protein [Candidatus Eiseniibacteriota bacterium]|nr:MAG: HAMP domain-containing protein [Candidatus Eisenbacteria bacterium]